MHKTSTRWHAGVSRIRHTGNDPVLLLLAACTAPPPEEPFAASIPESVANWRTIDLSHSYGADTLYWPTDTRGFDLETLAEGETEAGYFYAANSSRPPSTAAPTSTPPSTSLRAATMSPRSRSTGSSSPASSSTSANRRPPTPTIC